MWALLISDVVASRQSKSVLCNRLFKFKNLKYDVIFWCLEKRIGYLE